MMVTFKQSAGVLEVLFGVGFGGGDAVKRFVEDADDPPLFGERGERHFKLSQRFAGEVLNARAVEIILERAVEVSSVKVVEKPFAALWFMEAYAMERFLKVYRFVLFPDGRTSGVAAFANEHIAFDGRVFGSLLWQKTHLKHIGQIKAEPADVEVSEIRLQITLVLGPVKHLAERVFGDLAELLCLPAGLHSSALIFPSTSALSASSAAISSIISSGLRCTTASSPFGFFTERSKVAGSMPLASTLHDFGESANTFCSLTNSARSSSFSGLVLPRLRPGSS